MKEMIGKKIDVSRINEGHGAIVVTLRQILDSKPCYDPRERGFLPADHDIDAPIGFRDIYEKAGAADTVWCFAKTLPGHKSLKRHFAVDCAERVRHLMTDPRSLNALVVARRYALGQATDKELKTAWAAADAATDAAAWQTERTWQAERLIKLAEAGEWSPIFDWLQILE